MPLTFPVQQCPRSRTSPSYRRCRLFAWGKRHRSYSPGTRGTVLWRTVTLATTFRRPTHPAGPAWTGRFCSVWRHLVAVHRHRPADCWPYCCCLRRALRIVVRKPLLLLSMLRGGWVTLCSKNKRIPTEVHTRRSEVTRVHTQSKIIN